MTVSYNIRAAVFHTNMLKRFFALRRRKLAVCSACMSMCVMATPHQVTGMSPPTATHEHPPEGKTLSFSGNQFRSGDILVKYLNVHEMCLRDLTN